MEEKFTFEAGMEELEEQMKKMFFQGESWTSRLTRTGAASFYTGR